eukprot:TRINITY_DN49948_c0_g1_i1.p1 TRINITY_DN49948_c0_g1~~TRINITY_DN49948_c0_g1_i1.p1  ORF type:complete len:237 (+),score=16.61 TRINITY_DN49948_c0_g1_i1:75-713(+)
MLQANKADLITHFHKSAMDLRQLELDYYVFVFNQMTTSSSLLGGFASSALMVAIPNRDNPIIVTLFLLSTASALGSNLLVVIVGTMCVLWGPGHALKGGDANYVDNACEVLDSSKTSMQHFFLFGIVCYFTSAILVVWLLFDKKGAIIISVSFVVITSWLAIKSWRIAAGLDAAKYASGRVLFNRVRNVGKLMGDNMLSGDGGFSAAFASRI